MYLVNRDSAMKLLSSIAGNYDQIATTSASDELRNRARLGQGRVSEMRNRLDEARQYYASVEGPLAVVAAARLKALEAKGIDETTKWLARAELPRPAPPTGPGSPGVRPGLDADVPPAEGADPFDPTRTMEDFLGGGLGDMADPGRYSEPAAADATAETGTDAAAETPPAGTPPADAAPADGAPADDGAAAEATPSDSTTPSEPAKSPETPAGAEAPADETPASESPAQQ